MPKYQEKFLDRLKTTLFMPLLCSLLRYSERGVDRVVYMVKCNLLLYVGFIMFMHISL